MRGGTYVGIEKARMYVDGNWTAEGGVCLRSLVGWPLKKNDITGCSKMSQCKARKNIKADVCFLYANI